MKCITWLWVIALAIPFYYVIDTFPKYFYKFDHEKLYSIAKASIVEHGDDVESLIPALFNDIRSEYPDLVPNAYDPTKWVFNVAGGAMVINTLSL